MLPAAKNKVNYKKVGEKLGHSPELVKKVNDAVYSFIREKIVNLPLSEIVCEEDFNKLRTAFTCLLYTSPSPRDLSTSRMPSSA